jgi:preprotein translocase subunit YajC
MKTSLKEYLLELLVISSIFGIFLAAMIPALQRAKREQEIQHEIKNLLKVGETVIISGINLTSVVRDVRYSGEYCDIITSDGKTINGVSTNILKRISVNTNSPENP